MAEIGSRPLSRQQWSIEQAILQTIAYADIFDYPLTAQEIHRYLVEVAAPLDIIAQRLKEAPLLADHLICRSGYFMLLGRESIIETRHRRAAIAASLWPQAVRYGQIIAGLPFVRMVAVTGALAVDNVEHTADIDYLIVTEPGRLWLCRALVIAVVRLATLRGDAICPNYFLSDQALVLSECNLYTAHELAQMVPIAGLPTYRRMRELNGWAGAFLPNAEGPPRQMHDLGLRRRPARRLAETVLRTPIGARLERWEMDRKVRKFTGQQNGAGETAFCADWCKGHFERHGWRTLEAFDERLRAIGL